MNAFAAICLVFLVLAFAVLIVAAGVCWFQNTHSGPWYKRCLEPIFWIAVLVAAFTVSGWLSKVERANRDARIRAIIEQEKASAATGKE